MITIQNLSEKIEKIESLLANRSTANISITMTTEQAAYYAGWSADSFKEFRKKGQGPVWFRPIKGSRAIRYLRSDIDFWLKSARDVGAQAFEARNQVIEANNVGDG